MEISTLRLKKDRLSLRCRSQKFTEPTRQGAIPPQVHLLCSNIHQNLPVSQKEQPVVVTIYGELYGGRYNYVTDGVCVQRGVDYCPTTEFICFDISVNGEFFLWDELKKLCGECEFPIVPEVARGDFTHLYKNFDLQGMKSYVPQEIHGLDGSNSKCEGVIIRSIGGIFPSFKWKQTWLREEPPRKPEAPKDTDELFQRLILFVNDARFATWCSKRSPDDIENQKNMGGNIKSPLPMRSTRLRRNILNWRRLI